MSYARIALRPSGSVLIGAAGAASLLAAWPAAAQLPPKAPIPASAETGPAANATPPADAYKAAEAGYSAMAAGDLKRAAQNFSSALQTRTLPAEPERNVRLSLADVLMQLHEHQLAADLLAPLAAEQSYEVQARRAFALDGAGRRAEAASAYQAAQPLAPTPQAAQLMARSRVFALAALDRRAETLSVIGELAATPELPAQALVELASEAQHFGDDRLALRLYARADALTPLSGDTAMNAGYSARRGHDDAAAAHYFSRGLADAAFKGAPNVDQARFQVRREIAELTRRWGATASIFYDDSNGLSRLPGAGRGNLQAGLEVYYRPLGYHSGRPVEVFARAFETLDTARGDPVGAETVQGWVGVRAKPLETQNLVLEASRLVKLGARSRADWMVRASASAGTGMDLRQDRRAWPVWSLFGDAAHLIDADETFGVAEARIGRSYRTGADSRLILAPFAGLHATYDSGAATHVALGVEPGLWVRRWFRPGEFAAPRSFADLTLQYRIRLAGARRAEGLFASFSVSY
jgi:tetratricopeptide (TPR) repeat protein